MPKGRHQAWEVHESWSCRVHGRRLASIKLEVEVLFLLSVSRISICGSSQVCRRAGLKEFLARWTLRSLRNSSPITLTVLRAWSFHFFPNELKFYDASLLDFEARTLPVISLFSGVGGLELGLCGQGPHLIIDLFQCLADVLWHLLEPLNSSSLLQLKLEWLTLRQVHPVCYARSSFCQRIFFLSALSQYFFDPAG